MCQGTAAHSYVWHVCVCTYVCVCVCLYLYMAIVRVFCESEACLCVCTNSPGKKIKRPLQNDQFLWFYYFIGMCLSKMNIFVLFYKLLTTFLPNFKYKYCHLEHLFAEKLQLVKITKKDAVFPDLE